MGRRVGGWEGGRAGGHTSAHFPPRGPWLHPVPCPCRRSPPAGPPQRHAAARRRASRRRFPPPSRCRSTPAETARPSRAGDTAALPSSEPARGCPRRHALLGGRGALQQQPRPPRSARHRGPERRVHPRHAHGKRRRAASVRPRSAGGERRRVGSQTESRSLSCSLQAPRDADVALLLLAPRLGQRRLGPLLASSAVRLRACPVREARGDGPSTRREGWTLGCLGEPRRASASRRCPSPSTRRCAGTRRRSMSRRSPSLG